jgi:single-strand DNA-binding protein
MTAMTDQIAVTGNLTSAPERREVSGGVTMVTFGLASTERRYVDGTWVDAHTNFYNVSVFRRLADHALQSLEKGQRVIIQGKLKLRQWEVNGRSGTSADLEASSLGHDLMFGASTFVKDARSSATYEAPQATPDDEWAETGTVAVATGEVRGSFDEAVGVGDEQAGAPQLVGAAGWSAPMREDGTPF